MLLKEVSRFKHDIALARNWIAAMAKAFKQQKIFL